MLVSDLSFVFWCAPGFSSWFWYFLVFFYCCLYGMLHVLEVLWCGGVWVCLLCFCDCCFYVVEYRCLVFVISVGGECFYFTVCFSRFLFVEYGQCG